jgi:nitrogen PTS system EIIA component
MNLTVRDAAGLLNVSEKTIYRWISEGTLPAYKVHDQYRFNRAELLEWATANRTSVSPAIFREPESANTLVPTLADAIQSGGIYYRIEGTTKATVLRSVVEHLRLPDGADREFLYSVLLAREELASTGYGEGIAIPHVRNPVIQHITHPSIALCFLETPVDFGALDREPVYALFTIISPTVRAHLHMLSHLSFALRDATLRSAVQRRAIREEILAEFRRVESLLSP